MVFFICYFRKGVKASDNAKAVKVIADSVGEAVAMLFSMRSDILHDTEGEEQKHIHLCDSDGLIIRTADLINGFVTQ